MIRISYPLEAEEEEEAMNSSGPAGIPGLIPRGQQIINLQSGGTITLGRHGQPVSGGHVILSGNQNQANNPAVRRQQGAPPPKLMRLRCRFRPLHDAYIKNGCIVETDADVIFLCGDGHQLKAHKVIMASSSKFFAKIFEDQTNQIAIVSVPDVKVDVMKLILQLTYRDRVILTMRQIKEVGEFITIFGMAWTQFGYEEYSGDEQMSALPMPPIPMKPVDLPRPPASPQRQQPQVVRKIVNVSGGRITMLQNDVSNGNEEEEYVFQQQGQSPQERHSRKSRLTPRAGTEGDDIVEQDEEEDPESVIQTWMSKLGKRDAPLTSTPNPGASGAGANAGTGGGPAKRMRVDESGEQKPLNSCSVCRQMFNTETAWRWHEDRHVGHKMFKCKFCDELSNTPKACWLHERDIHGFSGLQFYTPQNQQQQQQQQQQQPSKPVTTYSIAERFASPRPTGNANKFVGSPGQQLSKRIKMQTLKKVQAQKKKAATEGTKLSNIGIGDPNGSENLPVNKLKQLHWLYVCEKCENCADSASKATMHYNRCFPNREKKFEDTVKKYRQGFYGKSVCPLCSRRYPQNSGFMIHCGHQHQQYRKLFTHIGSEDQLKCSGCKKQFAETVSFHDHLKCTASGTYYCGSGQEPTDDTAVEEPTTSKPAPVTRSSSEGKSGRQSRAKRPESPIESKAYKVQFHTPPRSARLASRVLAEAQAETAKANQAKASAQINFPPVDCPVCGDSDLPNISSHLRTKHKDLNVDVTRISSELLRCKGCTITFDICDLLDHKNCMDPPQETAAVVADEDEAPTSGARTVANLRRSSAAAASSAAASKPAKPAPLVVDMDSLPPGVGRSPIENIEIEDLHSIQAIRSALKCLICGTTAKKLGVIADCLRAHGIHRCSLCFNSYCNKGDYALHLKKCHGSGSNKLKCPLCPKSFANAGQTSGHMYSTHWLQMLKENEEAMKNEEENEEAKDEDTEMKDKEDSSMVVDTSGSNEEGKEEGGVEEAKTEKDESTAEVSNESETVGKEGEGEEEEDDDDEDKMEIDESSQVDDETEAVTGTAEDLEKM